MLRIVVLCLLFLSYQQAKAEDVRLRALPELLGPFLTGKPIQARCDEYMQKANELSGITLLLASAHCTRSNDLVEAAFLLNASNIRLAVELEYFPPSAEENEPMSFLNMVRTFYTSGVGNDKVFHSPSNYTRLKSALISWQPQIDAQSSPGWSVRPKQDNKVITDKLNAIKNGALTDLDKWAQMLQDDQFHKAKSDYEKFNAINPQFVAGSDIGAEHDRLKKILDEQFIKHICKDSPNTSLHGTHYMPLLGIPCAPEL